MSYINGTALFILKGSIVTIKLFLVVFMLAVPLGGVLSLVKISKSKICNNVIGIYTWIFRGTPLLLQLFFIYFGLPVIGIKLSRFTAASIAFTLNYGAYLTEIFRAGFQSVDKGQYEAAKALGMSYYQIMRRVIIPQGVRRSIPSTCNEGISLVKDTALVATIGMEEILRASKEVLTRDFTITPFFISALIYLCLNSIVVIVFKGLEKKCSYFE
ncbi:polar amino acid transport system permease protein [Clostridium tetanomorphum]|uniref:Amino acid ABC transporter permease n=1 Tax=Clostridium tetanomorphum TaxID=1553 RepID=A0A923E8I1_CLOTT|nr:amino acid ABC transporter permease [Clostridium tetanomorphum]KAJ49127.1 amino acid ABC transporter permease [Clostridium tetanomorphum DSM 665]KAJ53049.1 amino acid ABC transporter permease [Clostridium tetanomorphum DSM 665]MBC2398413.1 amino acid ABC transporter permease [Clostridium tetanomorphum]MBP1865566.1 polar amino acid transport system permease protein [Clostridium tetanomorphum]NRS86512.1 polar amino acid transport system permease protein [Clostridium tetanomorphum]